MSTPSLVSEIVPPLRETPPVEEKVRPVVPEVVRLPVESTVKLLLEPTEKVLEGAVVATPTGELLVSTPNKPPTVKAVVTELRLRLALPEVEVSDKAPVVRVKPSEAVKVLALVIVPEPVVDIFALVVMLFDVDIVPNPEAILPELRAPTVVNEDVVIPDPKVVDDN